MQVKQNFSQIDKHLRKMIRKTLILTVDLRPQYQQEQAKNTLIENFPSYLHLAAIMNERTQEERETFGKVKLSDLKINKNSSTSYFTEEKVDALIDIYIGQLQQPNELIVKTVERSRDRFIREFSKYEAYFEQIKFFSEEGVKERKEKVKLKVFMNQTYGAQNVVEAKAKGSVEMFQGVPIEEQALRMLQVHNSKVEKILRGYRTQHQIRKNGGEIEEKEEENFVKETSSNKDGIIEIKKPKALKKKPFKKVKKEVGVVIQIKGQDGSLTTYNEESKDSCDSSRSEKENQDAIKPKKKTKTSKIQSEQTLEMLKSVLKPNSKTKKEKQEVQIIKEGSDEDKEKHITKAKPSTAVKKSVTKKVTSMTKVTKPQDTMTRFINNFGDTPHLQAIEDSYLKYLEAQYAKESHLKEVKKFQILCALRKIQRFWKIKYQEIRQYCALRIQNTVKLFIQKLRIRNLKLYRIKKSLLLITLQRALVLYIKKRRIQKSKIRPNILQLVNKPSIHQIQGLIRRKIANKRVRFIQTLKKYSLLKFFITNLDQQRQINREIRDKETYYVQRYALAKIEIDSIMKYIQKAESKFELNWVDYENQLEKYLTQNKQYKDWAQKKDDCGNVYWINMKTMKEQKEHPGRSIFFANKKTLKAKADEELRDNFKPIFERRMKILETIMDIKSKIQIENLQKRQDLLYGQQE
eukprot:403334569